MTYLKFSFSTFSEDIKEMLIAKLVDIGFEGFEENEMNLFAYLEASLSHTINLDKVLTDFDIPYSQEIIPEQNWNATWEESFQPVIVGDFCTIRASFHAIKITTQYDIIITPKMSFGTGHHATTYLMIQQMQKLDFENKNVLDFGTGTGILAILASKSGAEKIVAIDNDDWSFTNSKENAEQNDCSKIKLAQCSLNDITENNFDIILANINRNILLQYMSMMAEKLADSGILLLSGLLEEDFDAIDAAASKNNFTVIEKFFKENWISIQYQKAAHTL